MAGARRFRIADCRFAIDGDCHPFDCAQGKLSGLAMTTKDEITLGLSRGVANYSSYRLLKWLRKAEKTR
jgi:hypothetical protein